MATPKEALAFLREVEPPATPVDVKAIEESIRLLSSDRFAVRDRAISSLRDRVSTVVDAALHKDQVRITLTAKDGRKIEKFVEHAVGSLQNPMSDADLSLDWSTCQRQGGLRTYRRLLALVALGQDHPKQTPSPVAVATAFLGARYSSARAQRA